MKEAIAALLVMTAADLPEGSLDALHWEKRPVLVFAEQDDPRLAAQIARFEANAADMAERLNVVIIDTETGGPLRARFRPEGFTVVLVGLDGGEKFRSGALVGPDDLDALIDTMPMRRRELQRRDAP